MYLAPGVQTKQIRLKEGRGKDYEKNIGSKLALLGADGKINYGALKPVLFEWLIYTKLYHKLKIHICFI